MSLILIFTSLLGKYYYYSHLPDQETEKQKKKKKKLKSTESFSNFPKDTQLVSVRTGM